jgi:histidinol dehydrogenase
MNIIKYPARDSWEEIVKRPHLDVSQLNATVCEVLKEVKENGDEAVKRYEQKFDHVHLDKLGGYGRRERKKP